MTEFQLHDFPLLSKMRENPVEAMSSYTEKRFIKSVIHR